MSGLENTEAMEDDSAAVDLGAGSVDTPGRRKRGGVSFKMADVLCFALSCAVACGSPPFTLYHVLPWP